MRMGFLCVQFIRLNMNLNVNLSTMKYDWTRCVAAFALYINIASQRDKC
jgi:hypothetical protein